MFGLRTTRGKIQSNRFSLGEARHTTEDKNIRNTENAEKSQRYTEKFLKTL
jgi:hypothetical protein